MMVFRLALRNLFLHRGKTLVLGLIVAVGLFVLVLGNSLMDTVTEGLEKTYTRSFTADLAVVPPGDGPQAMFSTGTLGQPTALADFEGLVTFVTQLPGVQAVTPQLNSRAQVSIDEREGAGTLVAGIAPETYRKVFGNNIQLLEGEFLQPSQEGVLLTERTRDALRELGIEVKVGQSVVLTNRNPTTGFKAREVTLRGILRFTSDNTLVQRLTLADITTARILAGLNTRPPAGEPTPAAGVPVDPEAAFLTQDSLESTAAAAGGSSLLEQLNTLLSPEAGSGEVQDPKTWSFLLIRLDNPSSGPRVASKVREFLAARGGGQVQDWVATVGPLAEVVVHLRLIFNLLVFVVGLVALLVIMNSLVISVTERVPEIGTIRALGAQRRFVRRLITTETLLTSVLFGTAGIALAAVCLGVSGLVGLRAPNEIVATLIGGHVIHPTVTTGALLQSLGLVIAVGLLASVYPVTVALRISPVQAMQSH